MALTAPAGCWNFNSGPVLPPGDGSDLDGAGEEWDTGDPGRDDGGDEGAGDLPADEVRDDGAAPDIAQDDPVSDDVSPGDDGPPPPAEICDNGVDDDGDGSTDCTDTDCFRSADCADICLPIDTIECGSEVTGSNEGPLSTDRIEEHCEGGDGYDGPEVAYQLDIPDGGYVGITLTGLSEDLDLFFLGNDRRECDNRECIDYSDNGSDDDEFIYTGVDPGTYYILVNGWEGAHSSFTLQVECFGYEVCGNGLDDDGDGWADCEDDDCWDTPGCGGHCTPVSEITCGSVVSGDTAAAGATDVIDGYTCPTEARDESGPEVAFVFTVLTDTNATFSIDSLGTGYLDLYVLVDPGSGWCGPSRCIGFSATDTVSDLVSLEVVDWRTYYVVVDGFNGASGIFALSVTCP